ncbi:unnamed protein product [Acanthocheilonema viteae]|uniref:C2H2-type domain-containing protein n=1 Tax=Acanthocheilonema viteae TaxID=6277 RepID=A0A498S822_ACAVI|nr:unnamed protein product [Acanthocheilonema viteae]
MEAENGQLKEVRNIHCLLCNANKPFKGFLSHIRQKHLDYKRYKCTKCAFKTDDEDDSILHLFEKNHDLKFDNANYQEHLAVKIFQDCCREQFAIRNEMGKQKNVISGLLKHEVNLQTMSENRRDCGIVSNSTKCINNEENPESRICITKILPKATAGYNEPCKLSEPDDQTLYAFELFSGALENTETTSSYNLPNALAVNNVSTDEENTSVSRVVTSQLNTICHKCGKNVGVDYIAKKTHALQFHFTQDDDPEIAELLPATIKACFPQSLSWSDYQCTECGKALGTYGSRRNHVLKEHFYWSAFCPLSGCTAVISALDNSEEHFKLEHNISKLEMSKELKQKLKKMKSDRKNDLNRKLNCCFPCSLPPKRQVALNGSAYDSKHLPKPSITSVLSSLLHSQPINIAKKKSFTYSSSDTESSSVEDESDSGIKGDEHDIVSEKGGEGSFGISYGDTSCENVGPTVDSYAKAFAVIMSNYAESMHGKTDENMLVLEYCTQHRGCLWKKLLSVSNS